MTYDERRLGLANPRPSYASGRRGLADPTSSYSQERLGLVKPSATYVQAGGGLARVGSARLGYPSTDPHIAGSIVPLSLNSTDPQMMPINGSLNGSIGPTDPHTMPLPSTRRSLAMASAVSPISPTTLRSG